MALALAAVLLSIGAAVTDQYIMTYVEKERERCAQLCATLARGPDKDFLIHCIHYSIMPNEIEDRRSRYAEMTPAQAAGPAPEDDLADLLS